MYDIFCVLRYVHEEKAAWHRRCRGGEDTNAPHGVHKGRIDENASERGREKIEERARGGIGGKYIG